MTYELWVLTLNAVILLVLYGVQGTHVSMTAPAWGLGPRDNAREAPPAFVGRMERTVRNQIEAIAVFAPLILVAHMADVHTTLTIWGAGLFLGARVFYVPAYLAGIPYLRSLIWGAGFVGCIMIAVAVLTSG